MTAQQRQHPVAADEYAWRAPATTAVPRTAGRPVATIAAAAQTTVAPPRPFARPSEATTAAPAQARQVTAAAPAPIPIGQSAEPPGRQPENQSSPQLPALRIVCWQLALVLGMAAIGRPWPVVAGLLTGAAALLVWTGVRVRGRWLSDEVTLRARLLLRRRGHDLPGAEGGRVLLETLAPGARVHTVELAGAPAGVVSRGEELLAVLRAADPAALARLTLSGSLLADTGEPGAALPAIRLQLVLHRGPRQADRTRAWLAVRALRDPGFAADPELLVALNNVVRKLHRKLRGAGLSAAALTEQEVLATLVALTHTGPGRGAIREDRQYWRAGPITQVGVRLTGLGARPLRARVHALHGLLAAVPGAACTIAITTPEHDAVLRVAATTAAAADSAVERLLWMPPPGLRLERMDNQHAPAVAASLPIGGKP